ncbi:phage head closure protein [Emcibacter sp.]|uniref:phage head closure protein n=1 Tax=Emcibacter sp. TaxID=1979954 RepID=UPI002AA7414A|nr:phage head closure protein [Emcibacter sp.]
MTYQELRYRVTCQEEERTPDGTGGYATGWRDVATVWAAIMPVSAKMTQEARQQRPKRTMDIRVRFRADLEPCRRMLQGGKRWRVLSVLDPDGRGRWFMFRVEEEN